MMDIHISAAAGTLQVRPYWQDSPTAVLICHPHPLFGGSMDNKVVSTLARYWRKAGYSVLLFNFRGVGSSGGSHDHGVGEVDDLKQVLRWLVEQQPQVNKLILAGFSFGAYIAAAAADRFVAWQSSALSLSKMQLNRVVLVAPAVHHYPMQNLHLPNDTVVLIGDQDEIVPPQQVIDWAITRHYALSIMPHCSHFFHGHLPDLSAQLERHAV